jgi:sulfide dehydrogenase [flavocytochrome c] flavoprotein subunit
VGGGFGGATCANYLKRYDPSLRVTLVEPNKTFYTCPFSNTVIAGVNDMAYIGHSYDGLRKNRGVEVVHDWVTAIDATKKKVSLKGGKALSYDKLVVSPGIDFRWDAIGGYNEAASHKVPHAYQAGPQTTLLRDQLRAMKDGGVVIIAPPGNPFRCPPGPYERASMIAWYLKENKPKSKILILDAKDKFSKQGLFEQGWQANYPGMIEWIKAGDGGEIESIDINTMEITTKLGGKHKGDVINIIPPQKAGAIAHTAGLVNDDGWCPVEKQTFESTLHKDVYVIGDASVASPLPKSGFAASSEAKMAAAAIVTSLHGQTLPPATYTNTCYSLVTPEYGISVAAVYHFEGGEIKTTSSGVSPSDADTRFRHTEARHAIGWYKAITEDMFAV